MQKTQKTSLEFYVRQEELKKYQSIHEKLEQRKSGVSCMLSEGSESSCDQAIFKVENDLEEQE